MKVRLSTTVDAELLASVRASGTWATDAALVEAAFHALLRELRRAEIDAAYGESFERVPVDTADDWGSLTDFLDAAARS